MDKGFLIFTGMMVALALAMIIAIWSGRTAKTFETRRLFFAAGILTGLVLILLESMGMYYLSKPPSVGVAAYPAKEIFEGCLQIVPPIITLVIGYYFGSSTTPTTPSEETDS